MRLGLRRTSTGITAAVAMTAAAWLMAGCAPFGGAAPKLEISARPSLYPGFDSRVTDYVTRCAEHPVELSVSSPPGTETAVDGGTARGGNFTARVKLAGGQAFRFTVSDLRHRNARRQGSTTYNVRCLPSDFPPFSAYHSGATEASLYVVTPTLSLGPAKSPYIAIFDPDGAPLWWIRSGPQPVDAQSLPDGDLVWAHYPNGSTAEHSLDGRLVRTYSAPHGPPDPHEFRLLPNGDYFVAVYEQRRVDLTPCDAPAKGSIFDPVIEELRPDGSLLWSWDTAAHIPLTEVAPLWHGFCRGGDPYHFNSIAPDRSAFSLSTGIGAPGNDVVLSYRHEDAIYDVDKASGRIIWKLGGTIRPDLTNLTVLNDPAFDGGGGFGGQHDVRLLGDGTLTVYDNAVVRPRRPRAVRYGIDPAGHSASLLEQVNAPGVTTALYSGSATKLAGGDWVISDGASASAAVAELAPSRGLVFALRFGDALYSYRADLVPPGRLSRSALRAGMDAMHPR